MDDRKLKSIELTIAHWKDIHRNYYSDRPYIQITGSDAIYLRDIYDLEDLIQDYKKIKGKMED